MKYIPVAAHRGNLDGYPENTLPAFRSAYEIGVDMIELDLHMTKDGEIIVMHDGKLDRTTDMTGRICDMTLAEIRKADAGIKKDPKFTGEKVPTFREFLDLTKEMDDAGYTVPGTNGSLMTFNFEFKDYFRDLGDDFASESCDKTIALIQEYGLEDRCVINSFDGKLLQYVQDKWNGRFKLHGFHPYRQYLGDVYPLPMYCVCLFDPGVDSAGNTCQVADAAVFDAVKADGCQTWLGAGVKLEEHVKMGCERGADLYTSNEPAKLMDMLKRMGYRDGEWKL